MQVAPDHLEIQLKTKDGESESETELSHTDPNDAKEISHTGLN